MELGLLIALWFALAAFGYVFPPRPAGFDGAHQERAARSRLHPTGDVENVVPLRGRDG